MFTAMIFSLFLASPAQATTVPLRAQEVKQSVNFVVWEQTGAANETFYSCDGLEDLTSKLLKELGATRISVSCSGGLDDDGYWGSPSIDATFNTAQPSSEDYAQAATYQPVQLKGDDGCAAAQAIFDGVKGKFAMTSISGTDLFCEAYQGYRINARVLTLR
jgi:hypothetical protein